MRKSKLLLASSILSTLYLIFLIGNFILDISKGGAFNKLVLTFRTLFYIPHITILILALILNWVGYAKNIKWTSLMSGVLYLVCMFFMFINTIFVLPQMILSFIAYFKMQDEKNIVYKNTVINTITSDALNSNDKKDKV